VRTRGTWKLVMADGIAVMCSFAHREIDASIFVALFESLGTIRSMQQSALEHRQPVHASTPIHRHICPEPVSVSKFSRPSDSLLCML
jgi:hypothetical protein